jgi:hypothetical protein
MPSESRRSNNTGHPDPKAHTRGNHRATKKEKDAILAKFEEDKAKIHKEKEQLLTKKIEIEEVVNREFHSVTGLEQKAEEPIEHQVMKLTEVIQQLQQRVVELELQDIPSTPQEERDQ